VTNATAKVQVNLKTGAGYEASLINVYAESNEELSALIAGLPVAGILAIQQALQGGAAVAAAVPLAPAAQQPTPPQTYAGQIVQNVVAPPQPPQNFSQFAGQASQAVNQGAPAPAPSSGPLIGSPEPGGAHCQHGPLVYREWLRKDGTGAKNGGPFQAYKCAQNQRNCASVWAN